jgi:hypothetical protein
MRHEQASPPVFRGFPDLWANVTFVPLQFFTLVLPNRSRTCLRIVGYALRQLLGWVDEHGNPTRAQLQFTYAELIAQAGTSRGAIAEALAEAIQFHLLRGVDAAGSPDDEHPGLDVSYELCWDEEGPYSDNPAAFRGFYYPEAMMPEEPADGDTVRRPKAARKNIPNVFFDQLLRHERLSVIRVVGALLFYAIQWGRGGERRVPVCRSITELSRLTKLARRHVHAAVREACRLGYLEQIDAGRFDPAAGQASRSATYGIRWLGAGGPAAAQPVGPVAGDESKKGYGAKFNKGHGAAVQKGIRAEFNKGYGEQFKKGYGISIKTSIKTNTATTSRPPAVPTAAAGVAAAAVVLLVQAGFDELTAHRLARKQNLEVIQRQLEWLPLRHTDRNRLGLLRRAIEQDWPKPEGAAPPAGAPSPNLAGARQFASHYYAAYHGYTGEAATEPFAKDLELAAQFIRRLPALELKEGRLAEWGRRFGRMMRAKHQQDAKARPNLSFALVLYGDQFLTGLEQESAARQKAAQGKAQQAHQAAFEAEYLAYLQRIEKSLQEAQAALYQTFAEERQRQRHQMNGGVFLASAETLARFDSEASRLRSFAEFFQRHPQCPVPDFWAWDAQHNPHGLGRKPGSTPSSEARA